MDFRQLKYFVRIAESGGLSRAAQTLYVAQPALSQQMSKLEADLGARLFDRSSQGVRLTPAGETLLRHAQSLLKQLEAARSAVKDPGDGPQGRVTVGLPGSTGKLVAAPLLRQLAAFPGILLEIVERPSADLVDLLTRGRLDVGIAVDIRSPAKGVEVAPLVHEELYVICATDSGVARRSISLRTLAGLPLILPSPPSTIRQRVDAAFLQERLRPKLALEASATDLVVRLVREGLGATVLPWAAVAVEVARREVRAVPLAGLKLARELSLCRPAFVQPTRACETVHRLLQTTVHDLIRTGGWRGAGPTA